MTGDDEMYAALRKMPVYRCPAVRDKTFVLTYVANGTDYAVYARSRTYTSSAVSRIDDLPASPSLVAYIWELNLTVPCDYFGVYDFFDPTQVTYWNGVPNLSSRTIRFDDPRHDGRTTMSFFDGHAETRDLVASQFPNRLLNPLEK
jgi:prepilin-type processing-associated H-X9-DG protein